MTKLKKKNPKIIKFKKFFDKKGYLIPFETSKKKINTIPFNIKRVFFSSGKKNYFRGDHAHKKCSQFLICINGKIKIETEYKNKKQVFLISANQNKALYLPPMTWNRLFFIKKNSILACLCDYKYDFKNEYINSYIKFKNTLN